MAKSNCFCEKFSCEVTTKENFRFQYEKEDNAICNGYHVNESIENCPIRQSGEFQLKPLSKQNKLGKYVLDKVNVNARKYKPQPEVKPMFSDQYVANNHCEIGQANTMANFAGVPITKSEIEDYVYARKDEFFIGYSDQNILEMCLDEEKRPAFRKAFSNIDF
jgi:hypothetical protein